MPHLRPPRASWRGFNELHAADEDDPRLAKNWFSLASARRVRKAFVDLDVDESGGLSREEFRAYTVDPRFEGACDVQGLTAVFADRIFEAHSLKGPSNARLAREAFATATDTTGGEPFVDPFVARAIEAARAYGERDGLPRVSGSRSRGRTRRTPRRWRTSSARWTRASAAC